MADTKRRFRSRRPEISLDELGGRADGGLAILDSEGNRVHMTPPRVAAAMRYFVARVQLHDATGMPDRLAFTSAVLGEGVTYVLRSLAAVLSYDTQETIAVVDLNWRRPPAEGAEPLPPGLAGVVEDGRRIDDVIVPTSNPRLALVPAGAVPLARRPALSGSAELRDVVEQIAERYDHMLLDLPPVLMSSDTLQLSQLADAFVLVVRQGVTPEAQVESALEELRGADCLGVVLNRFDTKIPRRLRRLVGA
jgi:Mrp family chromosome partitioning ATPase